VIEYRPSGLTTIAVADHKSVLAERPLQEDAHDISGYDALVAALKGRDRGGSFFEAKGFDILHSRSFGDIAEAFGRIQWQGRDYLVMGLGCIDSFARDELNRSDLPILVASASLWRLTPLFELVKASKEHALGIQNWTVAVNTLADNNLKYFKKTIGGKLRRIESITFSPDPLHFDENVSALLSRLLAPVLPVKAQRKGADYHGGKAYRSGHRSSDTGPQSLSQGRDVFFKRKPAIYVFRNFLKLFTPILRILKV